VLIIVGGGPPHTAVSDPSELDTIDLHRGPCSTNSPYTVLDVIGVRLTGDIREALLKLGFTDFAENSEGFSAERGSVEAGRLRE
jgi:hypothetical protein